MNDKKTHESWIQKLHVGTLHVGRWLPQKYNNRYTVMVIIIMAITMVLFYTSDSQNNQALLSDHYNRISSAAYSHVENAWNFFRGKTTELLNSVYCSSECPCACRPWRGPNDAEPLAPVTSNCGPTADRRGPRQNVLSYTYFGTNGTAYLDGIEKSAMAALGLYPGWTMRVYYNGKHTSHAWNKTVCEIICRFPNVDLCDVRHLPGLGDISNQTATIWRFAVIADESVNRFAMRDLDAILIQRERDAVDEWLGSNKTFHIMRDHPRHGSPIIAGMWGGWNRYNDKYRVVRQKMFQAVNPTGKLQWDQWLLGMILWPELLRTNDVMTHDSYYCQHYSHTRPFPKRRKDRTAFVGSQYTNSSLELQWKCPTPCRPHEHRDWKYC